MSTPQYPGPDPDDPFAKAPDESATPPPAPTEETAPIQREEVGYWEKLAQEQAGQTPPPPPPASPSSPSAPAEPGPTDPAPTNPAPTNPAPINPAPTNPWAGYGESATPGPPPPPPAAPPAANPYGAPAPYAVPGGTYTGFSAQPPNHPQSTTALVLGIVSIGCCGILGPFAWVIGGRARREIKASNGQLGGDGAATAGWIMGIIASVLLIIAVLFGVLIVILGVAGSFGSSTSFSSAEF